MTSQKFIGTGVAVTTPFKNNKKVDYDNLKKHIRYLAENGIDYFVVLGTTGEYVTLTEEEKQDVVETFKSTNNGNLPIVLGMGGNNTEAVVNKVKNTDFRGIDAILSVAPYYNKPSQEGLYQHFKTIAENSSVPVILYNVPGRTGVNIAAETIVRLAHDVENIVAVKEASGSFSQAMHIVQDKPEDFQVISGEDALTLPLLAAGISGVISVVGNAYPRQFSRMINYALKNDFQSAREIHYQLLPVIEKLFAEGNPAGIKCALEIKGLISNNLRLPLVKVSQQLHDELKEIMKTLD